MHIILIIFSFYSTQYKLLYLVVTINNKICYSKNTETVQTFIYYFLNIKYRKSAEVSLNWKI